MPIGYTPVCAFIDSVRPSLPPSVQFDGCSGKRIIPRGFPSGESTTTDERAGTVIKRLPLVSMLSASSPRFSRVPLGIV